MLADKIVPTSMTHSTMLLSRLAAEMPLLISVDWLDMLSVGVPLPDSVVPLLLVKASVV